MTRIDTAAYKGTAAFTLRLRHFTFESLRRPTTVHGSLRNEVKQRKRCGPMTMAAIEEGAVSKCAGDRPLLVQGLKFGEGLCRLRGDAIGSEFGGFDLVVASRATPLLLRRESCSGGDAYCRQGIRA